MSDDNRPWHWVEVLMAVAFAAVLLACAYSIVRFAP